MQYVADPESVKAKYNLEMLRDVENLVADAVQISIPFNNPITGFCAFTHKAGIHAKAILANPSTYEMCVLCSSLMQLSPETDSALSVTAVSSRRYATSSSRSEKLSDVVR